MRSFMLALVLAACATTPPPVAPLPPEPPPAPPPAPMVTALPSMLPPGESAMPSMAPTAADPTAATTAAPTAAGAAGAVFRQRPGAMERSMTNCPTAVPGATTHAVNTEFGVELTITAEDPAAQRRIADLAARQERMGDPDGSAPQHTGLHGGPGRLGHCPVIHDATTVTFTRLRRGVVIHLRALLPSDVARVQALVADRIAEIAER